MCSIKQARRQKPQRGQHFVNTILDVCSNHGT